MIFRNRKKNPKNKAKVLKGKITVFHCVHPGPVFNILCGELGLLLSLRLSGIVYLNPSTNPTWNIYAPLRIARIATGWPEIDGFSIIPAEEKL